MIKRIIALLALLTLVIGFASCDLSDVINAVTTDDILTSVVQEDETTAKSDTSVTESESETTSTTPNDETTSAPETQKPANIPSDAVEFGGHYYKVYTFSGVMTWNEALAECFSLGGYLATLTSEDEHLFVAELVKSSDKACWLGGHLTSDGEMKWISGESFSYTNWDDGEPSGAYSGSTEAYVGIYANDTATSYSTTGKWNDFSHCSATLKGFVCEWNADGTGVSLGDGEMRYVKASSGDYYTLADIGTLRDVSNIEIPESYNSLPVKKIAKNAFAYLDGIESVTIPESVIDIGATAFRACKSLKRINYVGSESEWENVTKGSSWDTETGNYTVEFKKTEVTPDAPESEFYFTQESVVENNNYTSSVYSSFNKKATAEYVVPGLKQGFVPQGMDVWEAEGVLLISGYFKDTKNSQSSVIFAVSLDSGKLVGEYFLKNADGSYYTGHAGGLAVTPYNLYFSEGAALHRIPLSIIKALNGKGEISVVEKISVPVRASFCNYSDGILWVGDFYYGTSYPTDEYRHMTNRDGKQYCAWSVGYYLADSEDEFTDEKYNANLPYATPDTVLSIDERIQGFAVVGDYIALSQSYGRTSNSTVYLYKNVTKTEAAHTSVTLNGKSVPVWFLDSAALSEKYTTLPMSEGLAVYNGELYILFESGASYYKDDGGKNPTDRVWRFKIS